MNLTPHTVPGFRTWVPPCPACCPGPPTTHRHSGAFLTQAPDRSWIYIYIFFACVYASGLEIEFPGHKPLFFHLPPLHFISLLYPSQSLTCSFPKENKYILNEWVILLFFGLKILLAFGNFRCKIAWLTFFLLQHIWVRHLEKVPNRKWCHLPHFWLIHFS